MILPRVHYTLDITKSTVTGQHLDHEIKVKLLRKTLL